jgi:hypothetical protein
MDPKNGAAQDDNLLYSTANGSVRHCKCRDLLVLHFLGYWLVLPRPGYQEFHARLVETAGCPLGRKRLEEGSRFAFRTEAGAIAFTLGMEEMKELLWLLDSARFMLEAGDAAAAGFAASGGAGDRENAEISPR